MRDFAKPYVVRVTFVDNTYWDDGQRWTSRWHDFDGIAQAMDFKRAILKGADRGMYQATSYVTNKTDWFGVDEDSIRLFRVEKRPAGPREHGTKTQALVELEDADIVTLLGQVSTD